jgi:hypothetical protein
MTNLSPHITENEVRCKCCGILRISDEILNSAEMARQKMNDKYGDQYGEIKLHISSGCRCPKHNKDEGGKKDSQHITVSENDPKALDYNNKGCCTAFDGWFYYGNDYKNDRLDCEDIVRAMYETGIINGLGLYPEHRIHMDTRNGRWFKDYR